MLCQTYHTRLGIDNLGLAVLPPRDHQGHPFPRLGY